MNENILRRLVAIKTTDHDQTVRTQIAKAVCGDEPGETLRFLGWLIAEFEARVHQNQLFKEAGQRSAS
jgi:hypothetical protein